jgi:hypothetical protein
MLGIPTSWQKVTWSEMVVIRFVQQFAEKWAVSELAGQLLVKAAIKQ